MIIPASYPDINEEDKKALHSTVDIAQLTEWKRCTRFSEALCHYVGAKHATLLNSGSSANFIAIRSLLDIYPGKLILTTATAFPTTVAPIYQHGCIPVYVDTDPKTLLPDMGQIAYMLDAYGHSICGAILTHTLGFPFNEPLVKEMLGNDRWLIVDGCDALGAEIGGIPIGTWANAQTHSFFPAHHICGIQSGAITTNDEMIYELSNQYIRWGRDCRCLPGQNNVCGKRFEYTWKHLPLGWDHKYTFTQLGYNMQINELACALLFSQIQRIEGFVDARNKNYNQLKQRLNKFENYLQFVDAQDGMKPSPFGFPIFVRDKIKTLVLDLIQHLEADGIATRRMFGGNLIRQPAFANLSYIKAPDLDGSDKIMDSCFWIGCHPNVTQENIDYIVDSFDNFFNKRGLF